MAGVATVVAEEEVVVAAVIWAVEAEALAAAMREVLAEADWEAVMEGVMEGAVMAEAMSEVMAAWAEEEPISAARLPEVALVE